MSNETVTFRIYNLCKQCGKTIVMMCQRGTGFCCAHCASKFYSFPHITITDDEINMYGGHNKYVW